LNCTACSLFVAETASHLAGLLVQHVTFSMTAKMISFRLIHLLPFLFSNVWSWIPPHPNSTIPWESVHDMRRRLGHSFNYTTRFVDAELCRFMTEEECEEGEAALAEHAKAHRGIQKQFRNNPKAGKVNVSRAKCLLLSKSIFSFVSHFFLHRSTRPLF
jgi:hypothetical protein